jgi:hypothetical protein
MIGKLTKKLAESIGAGDKDRLCWDSEVAGFGLKVTLRGKRLYILQARISGRQRRLTIGVHVPMTCEQARQEAARLLARRGLGHIAQPSDNQ